VKLACPEMDFLGISLTKDSSLLLHAIHAIHSLSTGGFLRKPGSTLVLKIYTKIKKSRKLETICEKHFV
jgi:hypothetical protein